LTSHFQDVISRIKVLPPGGEHEASAWRLCSSVCMYVLGFRYFDLVRTGTISVPFTSSA